MPSPTGIGSAQCTVLRADSTVFFTDEKVHGTKICLPHGAGWTSLQQGCAGRIRISNFSKGFVSYSAVVFQYAINI